MKQYNSRLDEKLVSDACDVAEIYNVNLSELVREGLTKVV